MFQQEGSWSSQTGKHFELNLFVRKKVSSKWTNQALAKSYSQAINLLRTRALNETPRINITTQNWSACAAVHCLMIWLALWAGKMNQILHCDWLPSGQDGAILPAQDYPPCPAKRFLRNNKSFIDQVCSFKMAGYWPHSFSVSLWIETESRSINTERKNLANIQPSWPRAWSINHISCFW